jgi:hypothetical protein
MLLALTPTAREESASSSNPFSSSGHCGQPARGVNIARVGNELSKVEQG